MKSVLQSFWLLTVAFGDLIVVILASVLPAMGVVSHTSHRTDLMCLVFVRLRIVRPVWVRALAGDICYVLGHRLGKTLYSHGSSIHSGVQVGTCSG